MAKLSDLVAYFASMGGLDGSAVEEIARRLRMSGNIQKGKRGRYGGAIMSERDAAALAIAIIGRYDTSGTMDAPAIVDLCGALVLDRFQDFALQDIEAPAPEFNFGLPREHTFMDAVSAIISDARDSGLLLPQPHFAVMRLEVAVERNPWATGIIRVWGNKHLYTARYIHPEQIMKKPGDKDEAFGRLKRLDKFFGGRPAGYTVERTLDYQAFTKLGDCLRGE